MKKTFVIIIIIFTLSFFPSVVHAISDGWLVENGKTYYIKNGEKVKGFQKIGEKTYFFSNVNSALKEGWQAVEEGRFYLNSDGTVNYGFKEIEGNTYYFNEKGFALKGFQKIGEKTYFFSNVNNALKEGWQAVEEGRFYLNSDGTVNYGFKEIEGNTYYFNEKGFVLKGFQKIGEKTYFFSNVNNALKKGWQALEEGRFYLNSDGTVNYGLKEIEGNTYYFNEKGFAATGFQVIEGKKYFFDIINNRLLKGWQNYKGNFYADSKTGEIQSDGYFYLDNETYYIVNGYTVSGIQTIDGKKYFFSRTGHNELKTGWIKDNGDMYYCSPTTHELVTGEQVVDGIKYDFGTDGKLKDGFVTDTSGNVKYYYSDGSYAVDWVTIAGRKYFFNGLGVMVAQDAKKVIDVSYHNKDIDWWTAKNSGGVDAAMIRLAYRGYGTGNLVTDTNFLANVKGANEQDIPIGVYVYSQAINKQEAIEEAERAISLVNENGGKNTFSMPIVIDTEYTGAWANGKRAGRADYLSKNDRTDIIIAFIERVKKAGYEPMIYASKNFLIENLNMDKIGNVKLWVAQYNHYCTYNGVGQTVMWQYSSTESVPGISTNTDVSVMF